MKRVWIFLSCLAMLLLCGCGGRLMTEARALPDVRILDETPTPLAEAPSPLPVRAEVSAPSPTNAAKPSPTPSPEPTPNPALCPYVGSKNSEIYHLAGCSQAARIKAENLLGWESIEAAEAAGRTPCKLCLPEQEATPQPTVTPQLTATTQPEETLMPIATPEPTAEPQPEERMTSGEYAYVGSKKSNKFHLPSCRYAQSIGDENRIGWATREAAEAAGYEACKVCKP